MKRIADLGSILLVHAEDPSRLASPAGSTARDFIWSRPADAELQAISLAVAMAGDTGCRLHIVHVSTARGVELIHEAQQGGVDASAETCPHYLLYVESDMERMGGIAKCAPPFRTAVDREKLWWMLRDGRLPMVVSDHSPSTLELKQGKNFLKIWGGISGCQSTRQLLLAQHRLELPLIAALTSTNVARRFGLKHKGEVALGFDADLWLVDLSHDDVVRKEDLLYRNPFSAHEGQPIRGRTIRTLVRGHPVFEGGRPISAPAGRLITGTR
jgi:allantoinase